MATETNSNSSNETKVAMGLPRSDDAPFESPPQKVEEGPLFVNIEERFADLAPPEDAVMEEGPKLDVDRRDFMRLFSASAIAASAAGCIERPEEHVRPRVNVPHDNVVGKPVHYATASGGPVPIGLMVTTREGRPTKIEGNAQHPLSRGATGAADQAALQALYHPERRRQPMALLGSSLKEVAWDSALGEASELIKAAGGKVGFLVGADTGSRRLFLERFLQNVGGSTDSIYTYDSNSYLAECAKAHELAFGQEGLPRTDLKRSGDLIVGIGAEFLDVGVTPVYDSKSFAAKHSFHDGRKGQFIQFESRMTSTGSQATERHVISAGDELAIAMCLVAALVKHDSKRGSSSEIAEINKVVAATAGIQQEAMQRLGLKEEIFSDLANRLMTKQSVVMVGTSGYTTANGTLVHLAGILANILIGAYGKALHFDRGWVKPPVKPGDMQRLIKDAGAGNIQVLIVLETNPVFALPESTGLHDTLLNKIPNVVNMACRPNEMDDYSNLVFNTHHWLESWGDSQSVAGFWTTRQPVVRPMYGSRQAEDVLLWILAKSDMSLPYSEYRDFVRESWQSIYKGLGVRSTFDYFFDTVLRRGFVGRLEKRPANSLGSVASLFEEVKPVVAGETFKLVAHLDNRLYDGEHADLPILQEVGDPLTSVAWDTWVAMAPQTARKLGFRYNEVLEIKTGSTTMEVSLYPMPGLAPDVIAIPRGNGHKGQSKVTEGVGIDPIPLFSGAFAALSGQLITMDTQVSVRSTGKYYRLCAMQKQNDIGNRTDIVKRLNLTDARKNRNKKRNLDDVPDLYPALHERDPSAERFDGTPEEKKAQRLRREGYIWGMSIDLDKCSACSACMVACALENNVPQVGRQQILLGREMHWLRIDRYFAGPVENPVVTTQPVMCQQCNHAPCEAVCPVFATVHDDEGINAQIYNRCIGTRYCANACPYKVRRFNWFTHKWHLIDDDPRHRNIRALNPDVTVRTKGVMEKCTFCTQRIHAAKWDAKTKRGPKAKIKQESLKTACQQVCPSDAIVFGNIKDPSTDAARMRSDFRAYLMLGADPDVEHYGIKTLPNVSYLAAVVHDGAEDMESPKGHHHHHHGDHGGHDH